MPQHEYLGGLLGVAAPTSTRHVINAWAQSRDRRQEHDFPDVIEARCPRRRAAARSGYAGACSPP